MTDPIADMLTRIRNAQAVGREWVTAPSSKAKKAIVELLNNEGYLGEYEVVPETPSASIKIRLRYDEKKHPIISGLRRISKPGLRVYADKKTLTRFYGGRGISVISTSQGLMTGRDAWRQGIGGEVICYVW